ncbi:hypothetical protein [Streptomyces sp. S063]|uniref:hypothetical protein n=1 Tax=Streptomyces sp. S063 TaxID=2005885 RepID=UPI0019D2C4FB|nr:hypothetical protein [Streptomyces sp. S063]
MQPRGERDEPVRTGDEYVELRPVLAFVVVVGVGQVMDGVDQRLPVPAERCEEVVQRRRGLCVEAEVEVEDVEGVRVFVHPTGIEHDRRPPLLGTDGHAARTGVGQPCHAIALGR